MNYIFVVLLFVSAISRAALAQPQDSPEFYKKNFAESPISKAPQGHTTRGHEDEPIDVSGSAILGLHNTYKKELQKQQDAESRERVGGGIADGLKGEGDDLERTAEQRKEAKVDTESDLFGDEPGVPVLTIGAVINSLDVRHFTEKVSELTSIARKYDFEMSRVYAVGDWSNMMLSMKALTKAIARKGDVDYIQEVPKQFNITISPTWIIETAEGDIVVEGLEPLGKYFNKKGEFVESKLKEATVAVSTAPTVAPTP